MRDLTLVSIPLNSARRDRPDSDTPDSSGSSAASSSDGDSPPQRRLREAGFIAWPLALLLFLLNSPAVLMEYYRFKSVEFWREHVDTKTYTAASVYMVWQH